MVFAAASDSFSLVDVKPEEENPLLVLPPPLASLREVTEPVRLRFEEYEGGAVN